MSGAGRLIGIFKFKSDPDGIETNLGVAQTLFDPKIDHFSCLLGLDHNIA